MYTRARWVTCRGSVLQHLQAEINEALCLVACVRKHCAAFREMPTKGIRPLNSFGESQLLRSEQH